ncbi:MAG: hypothetical protein QGM45_10455, partial [Anaerolineales bacterium]|nr:hypothetical protein [Anaerolineales bacterium]
KLLLNPDIVVKAGAPLGPPIHFTWPIEAHVPVHGYLVPLKLAGAMPLGCCGDMILAAHHEYGKGQVYYFGTYMGRALCKNIPEAHALLREILLGHARPVIRGDRLRPRLITSATGALLVAFNDHHTEAVSEALGVPDRFESAQNIVTGETYPLTDGKISLTVGPEDAVVLLLK